MISNIKLDFWIKNNYNVLMTGKHGVGKSSIIFDAFNRNNLKWKYFSASTMDPWVDFIGVPKEKTANINGKEITYLDLVRPLEFQTDDIEALFLDEFNRSHRKVRNAVMELIQFKSINGKKFNNLKVVWAAINPEDDEAAKYDVEPLDPAQEDRFQVKVELPYLPHYPYFKQAYGENYAEAAIEWWKKLPEEIKNKVSPRRLDYALNIYKNNGDMRDVLPGESNISKLIAELTYGSISKKLKQIYLDKNTEEAKKIISAENSYFACIDEITKKDEYIDFFVPFIEKEKLTSLLSKEKKILEYVIDNSEKFNDILVNIVKAGQNNSLIKKIKKKINLVNTVLPSKKEAQCLPNPNYKKYKATKTTPQIFEIELNDRWSSSGYHNTTWRRDTFFVIKRYIPENPSDVQSIKVLEYLSEIIQHSHCKTLSKTYKEITGLINHCLSNLHENGTIKDIRDFVKYKTTVGAAIEHVVARDNFYFVFK